MPPHPSYDLLVAVESHTRSILPVAVVAAMEAAKGSSRMGAELAYGALHDR